MTTFDEFKGNRHWRSDRPTDPKCADLGIIDIEIRYAHGVIGIDPNTMALFANGATLEQIKSMSGNFKVEGLTPDINGKSLTELEPIEDLKSVISGEPALLYRTSETEISLTGDEIRRLARRSLTPRDFFAICDAVGAIWEVHDDFYDPETGEAFQPMDDEIEDDDHAPIVVLHGS